MLLRLRKPKDAADLESLHALAKKLGYQVRTLDQDGTLVELSAPVDGSPRHGTRSISDRSA